MKATTRPKPTTKERALEALNKIKADIEAGTIARIDDDLQNLTRLLRSHQSEEEHNALQADAGGATEEAVTREAIVFSLDPILARELHLDNIGNKCTAISEWDEKESKFTARVRAVEKSLKRRTGLDCKLTFNRAADSGYSYRAKLSRTDEYGNPVLLSGSVLIYHPATKA